MQAEPVDAEKASLYEIALSVLWNSPGNKGEFLFRLRLLLF